MHEIFIVNQCTVLTDDQINDVIPAVQAQVTEDFAPIWNTGAALHFVAKGTPVPDGGWPLFVKDHTDVPGLEGRHTDIQGRVSGCIFAADAVAHGNEWTVDLSHELLEMLGDPTTTTMERLPDGRECVREICDPVADDSVGYAKNRVKVSNFVLPAYFHQGTVAAPFDFASRLTAPAPALTPGGYLFFHDAPSDRWTQLVARLENGGVSFRSHRLSRAEVRILRGQ